MPIDRSTPAVRQRQIDRRPAREQAIAPSTHRSALGVMRVFRRGLAMLVVGFAVAMSVSYVIPNAKAVEPELPAVAAAKLVTQVTAPVDESVVASAVVRDGYAVTLPPPPPKPKVAAKAYIALTPSSSSASLQWPVPAGTRVLSGFGARSCAGCSSYHLGVDLGAPGGSPIWAIADGVVVETNAPGYSSLGTHVTIQHNIDGQIIVSVYAHMVAGSMTLNVGDQVVAGQALGAVGCTGSCSGNHLHFEIHYDGVAVDPMVWMTSKLG